MEPDADAAAGGADERIVKTSQQSESPAAAAASPPTPPAAAAAAAPPAATKAKRGGRGSSGRPPNINENSLMRRLECILAVENGQYTMAEACKTYDISPRTYYRWLRTKQKLLELTQHPGEPAGEGASEPPLDARRVRMPRDRDRVLRNVPDDTPIPVLGLHSVRRVNSGGSAGAGPSRAREGTPDADGGHRGSPNPGNSLGGAGATRRGEPRRRASAPVLQRGKRAREPDAGHPPYGPDAGGASTSPADAHLPPEYQHGLPESAYRAHPARRAHPHIPHAPAPDSPGPDPARKRVCVGGGNHPPNGSPARALQPPQGAYAVALHPAYHALPPRREPETAPTKHRLEIVMGRRTVVIAFYRGALAQDIKDAIARRFALLAGANWALKDECGDEVVVSDGMPSGQYALNVFA